MSAERWRQAQAWEAAFWRAGNPPPRSWSSRVRRAVRAAWRSAATDPGDDWNGWWASKFDGYDALPARLERAIEFGCGPYTNIRLIAERRRIERVWCSDPLIRHYLTFDGRWLAGAWTRGEVQVDGTPLEECPFASDYFDLVVVINVLDHVRDAALCVRQAVRVTAPGGYLVLGQDLTDQDDHRRVGADVGHPIRLHHTFLDSLVLPVCAPRVHRVLPRAEGRNPAAHYGTYVFIGQKHRATRQAGALAPPGTGGAC